MSFRKTTADEWCAASRKRDLAHQLFEIAADGVLLDPEFFLLEGPITFALNDATTFAAVEGASVPEPATFVMLLCAAAQNS